MRGLSSMEVPPHLKQDEEEKVPKASLFRHNLKISRRNNSFGHRSNESYLKSYLAIRFKDTAVGETRVATYLPLEHHTDQNNWVNDGRQWDSRIDENAKRGEDRVKAALEGAKFEAISPSSWLCKQNPRVWSVTGSATRSSSCLQAIDSERSVPTRHN